MGPDLITRSTCVGRRLAAAAAVWLVLVLPAVAQTPADAARAEALAEIAATVALLEAYQERLARAEQLLLQAQERLLTQADQAADPSVAADLEFRAAETGAQAAALASERADLAAAIAELQDQLGGVR